MHHHSREHDDDNDVDGGGGGGGGGRAGAHRERREDRRHGSSDGTSSRQRYDDDSRGRGNYPRLGRHGGSWHTSNERGRNSSRPGSDNRFQNRTHGYDRRVYRPRGRESSPAYGSYADDREDVRRDMNHARMPPRSVGTPPRPVGMSPRSIDASIRRGVPHRSRKRSRWGSDGDYDGGDRHHHGNNDHRRGGDGHRSRSGGERERDRHPWGRSRSDGGGEMTKANKRRRRHFSESTRASPRAQDAATENASKTFVVESEHMDTSTLTRLLEKAGWKRISIDEACRRKYTHLVAVDGKWAYDKRLYRFKCAVKSRIGAKALTNKVELHERLQKSVAKDSEEAPHIATTKVLEGSTTDFKIKSGDVWIWRPEGGYAGKGVRVVTTQEELDATLLEHSRRGREPGFRWGRRGLLSRYITDPYLFKGRKFHIRTFFFVLLDGTVGRYVPRRTRTFMLSEGFIVTAKKRFRADRWDDKDIHDSHFSTTDGDFRFPRDFPESEATSAKMIVRQIETCLRDVSRTLAPTFQIYDESDSAYEIFGCDFMVTSGGRVVLIEINFKPSFNFHEESGIDPNDFKRKTAHVGDVIFHNTYQSVLVPRWKDVLPPIDLSANGLGAIALFDSSAPSTSSVDSDSEKTKEGAPSLSTEKAASDAGASEGGGL